MKIAVTGAMGRTGNFVLGELARRGHEAAAVVRADFADRASLVRAFAGADAVINCAGPFLDTAEPVIRAALDAGIHYVDITAEQESARTTLDAFHALALARGILIVPAAGFFGGLGDLLASAAMGDWDQAERIDLAIGLDSWRPTLGTRKTGERNTAPRVVRRQGRLAAVEPSSLRRWEFPQPFGALDVLEVPLSEQILISAHLAVSDVHNYMNETPLRDLGDASTPAPIASDERGRSDQRFVFDGIAYRRGAERRVHASGRDIYAVTAPIVVEAVERICGEDGARSGAFALGEFVDARSFLAALAASGDLTVAYS